MGKRDDGSHISPHDSITCVRCGATKHYKEFGQSYLPCFSCRDKGSDVSVPTEPRTEEFVHSYMTANPGVPMLPDPDWVRNVLRRAYLYGWAEARGEINESGKTKED